MAFGKSQDDAARWVARVDEPKATLIGHCGIAPDLVVDLAGWQ